MPHVGVGCSGKWGDTTIHNQRFATDVHLVEDVLYYYGCILACVLFLLAPDAMKNVTFNLCNCS